MSAGDGATPRRRGGVAGALAGQGLGRLGLSSPAASRTEQEAPLRSPQPAPSSEPAREEASGRSGPPAPPVETAGSGPAPTGLTGHTGHTGPTPPAEPPSPTSHATTVRPPRQAKGGGGKPRTVYVYATEEQMAKRFAREADVSGRLAGIVQGHIGVSLAVNVALNLLDEEFKRNPTAVLDRAVRVASRG